MTIDFTDYGEPAGREQIAAAEERLGVTFPAAFVDLLQRHNGSHPEQCELDLDDPDVPEDLKTVVLSFIFGVGVRESLDIEAVARDYEGRIPADTLPIGRDPGGSLFLLVTGGDGAGRILFWAADEEPPEGEDAENVFVAASSFDALLAKLRPPAEE